MSAPTENDVDLLRSISRLNGFLPELRTVLDKKMNMILYRTCGEIDRGELTQERAFSAWHEVAAYMKVLRTFDKKARIETEQAKSINVDIGD